MSDNGTEYKFTKRDGSVRYEIVFETKEVFVFTRLHDAVKAEPLKR